jgi:hypothetical protein
MAALDNQQFINEINTYVVPVNIDILNAEFAFQGFDVKIFYQTLKTKEPNLDQLRTDMTILCVFAMSRGPNLQKQLGRSSPAAVTRLRALINKYAIVDNIAAARGPTIVTCGRILCTFPRLCSGLAERGTARDPTNGATGCPRQFRFFTAPAIIREDGDYRLWLEWASAADIIVNGPRANAENVDRFGRIARTNSPFNKGPIA